MTNATQQSSNGGDLRRSVANLRQTIINLEADRDRLRRRQRVNLMLLGLAGSLLAHAALMVYLSFVYWRGPGGPETENVAISFANVQEEELTEPASPEIDDLLPDSITGLEDLPTDDTLADLAEDIPVGEVDVGSLGSMPRLGGAGEGEGLSGGLEGGGAGTSFFGISSKGTRFAYIVDISGSMGDERKLPTAMGELARSIDSLPDYAYFYVVLFQSKITVPPWQNGWIQARPVAINRARRWLEDIAPGGGTMPHDAFFNVFSLDVRPDVLFFLTDGRLNEPLPVEKIVQMNNRGKSIVINTVAFGSNADREYLRAIAEQCGGTYRFVPTGSN